MTQPPRPTPRPRPPGPGRPVGPRPILPTGPVQPAAQPPAGPPSAVPPEPISPQPQRDVEPRRPRFVTYPIPVSTTSKVAGREIDGVLGVVVGVATRPRDMAHNPEMSFINTAARQDALGAMVLQAQEAGAHAVVGVRFDNGKISETVTEITAYGTAVTFR